MSDDFQQKFLFTNKKMECVMGFAPLIVPRIFFTTTTIVHYYSTTTIFFSKPIYGQKEEAHTQSISKDQGFEDSIAFFKTTLKTIIII